MCRIWVAPLLLTFVGCQLPPERPTLKPLLEDSPPLAYAELVARARLQATSATESFYVDQWGEVEELARGLAQTARFFKKAIEVPPNHRATLNADADALDQDAQQLIEAARAHDVQRTTEVMRRINVKVREFRLDR